MSPLISHPGKVLIALMCVLIALIEQGFVDQQAGAVFVYAYSIQLKNTKSNSMRVSPLLRQ